MVADQQTGGIVHLKEMKLSLFSHVQSSTNSVTLLHIFIAMMNKFSVLSWKKYVDSQHAKMVSWVKAAYAGQQLRLSVFFSGDGMVKVTTNTM